MITFIKKIKRDSPLISRLFSRSMELKVLFPSLTTAIWLSASRKARLISMVRRLIPKTGVVHMVPIVSIPIG